MMLKSAWHTFTYRNLRISLSYMPNEQEALLDHDNPIVLT